MTKNNKNIITKIAEKFINTHQWTKKPLPKDPEQAILKFAEWCDKFIEGEV